MLNMWKPSETAILANMWISESKYDFIEIIAGATGSGHKYERMEFEEPRAKNELVIPLNQILIYNISKKYWKNLILN